MIYNATELILIISKDPKVTSADAENETLVVPGLNEHAAWVSQGAPQRL